MSSSHLVRTYFLSGKSARLDGDIPNAPIPLWFFYKRRTCIRCSFSCALCSPMTASHIILYALVTCLAANLSVASTIDHRTNDINPFGRADTLSFSASKWIWTPTSVPGAVRALRKDFAPPLGKSLIAADILISVDNAQTLFVNGELVGSSTRTRLGRRFCVDLLPSYNVFAVNASTSNPTDGALIAAILLTYSDLTLDALVTYSSWRVSNTVPSGFDQLSFDDTTWSVATVAGAYGAAPWGAVAFSPNPP
ncbi:hypothetical protein B0H10DRAFT_334315 [Mycena sp. CBHHK59/15]|nr:hypothetical protein B0H10DRAFT_334315 [Mycena sp. CBHHK59/15]